MFQRSLVLRGNGSDCLKQNSSIQLCGKKHQTPPQLLNGHYLVPETSTLKGLFQLNDSKSLHKENWVDITISTD